MEASESDSNQTQRIEHEFDFCQRMCTFPKHELFSELDV